MNQFRKREDGSLVDENYIRNNFDGGLPQVLDAGTLDHLGYDPVLNSPQPVAGFGQYVAQDGVELINDLWFFKWTVMDMPAEDVARMRTSAQESVWNAIKAERDSRKAGGLKLTVGDTDYWFWTDDPSRNQYAMLDSMARRKALSDDTKLDDWKTMDGSFVPFPVSLLHQVMDTGIANESALFHVAEMKRQAMLLADNPLTFEWQDGWPQTYAEYAAAKALADAGSTKPAEDPQPTE